MRKPIPYGRFLLLDRIAVGGMAEIFVAVRRGEPPGKLYTLKRILPTLAEDAEFITMFLDEARLVAQLEHPAIAPIHELGKQDEGYYIAMGYLAGRDLRALLGRCRAAGERIPVPLAAHVAAVVADGLDHAHRKRDAHGAELAVVHRDVSPANVLLGFDGSVRIIDFGIAQAAIRTRRQDTVLRGKFGYMSPEMARGQPVDRRSDVFALGAVLHEMLTGERLFRGRSELAVLEQVQGARVPPPSEKRPEVPPGLDAVVLRALAREPAERFQWASELRDALLPFAASVDPPALARFMARTFPADLHAELDRLQRLRAVLPAGPEPAPERTQVIDLLAPMMASSAASDARRGRRRAIALGSALGGAAAVAAAIALATGSRAGPAAPQPPASAAVAAPAATGPALGRLGAGRRGRLVVQPRSAATLIVDGVLQYPPLGPNEIRALDVAPGEHRVELRTEDGRRAGATVQVHAREIAELLGVELQ